MAEGQACEWHVCWGSKEKMDGHYAM
ncbi:uncharacterized protein METZ01_LOCUS406953, partial [marine metagenome]